MQYLEGRKYVVQGIFLVVALIFLTRLFFMQVLDGTYKLAADKNTLQRLVQTPYRGLIYDRKNVPLVQNTPVYDLMVVPREVKQLDSAKLCELLQIPLEEFRARMVAAKKYSRNKPSPIVQNLTTQDLAAIQDKLMDFPGFRSQTRMARAYNTPQPGPRPGLRGGHHAGLPRKAEIREVPARRKHRYFGPGSLLRKHADGPPGRAVQDGERARYRKR